MALPAFAFVDRALASFLGPVPRLVAWGLLMSLLLMFLYRLISPQQKLALIKQEAATVRRQVAAFDGEFDALTPLISRSLRLSLRQIAWILFPALLASLPLISCLMWMDTTFSYRTPTANEPVHLAVSPSTELISAVPAGALARMGESWQMEWPQSGVTIVLRDRLGDDIAQLKGVPGNDTIAPHLWWNRFIGNPMGYIPRGSPVEQLHFDLSRLELHGVGPPWARGWELPFFLTLILSSILLKVAFRIE